jgi:hypothetical protein
MAARTIVFVEPPYVCWDRRMDRVREGEEEMPGVGTLVLAAVARERGHRAHIVDGKRTGTPVEEVARAIATHDPDHVGIGATTISITNAAAIGARVKALVPRAVVTVGGPHVSAVPERTLEMFPGFDYGVVSEGERSYFDRSTRSTPAATRATSRASSIATPTSSAPPARGVPRRRELDRLPEPAWDLVPDFPCASSRTCSTTARRR